MRTHSLACLAIAPTAAPTRTRARLPLALSLVALAAGCGAEGTFNIIDLRSSSLGIGVSAVRSGEATRDIGFSVDLPSLPPDQCHEIPGDLDVTLNGRGPTGDGLTIGQSQNGHAFRLGCSETERYWLEGDFVVPAAAEVLTLKLEKDGEEITVRVTLPPDPPVSVALGATEVGRDSPLAVDLRATPNVLTSDASCWYASVTSRAGVAGNLSVSSAATEGGVRLQLALLADASPLPPGPATLTLSRAAEEHCAPPVAVSCLGVADCSVRRDLGRDFGPFDVQVR